jgi:hypothetical protein
MIDQNALAFLNALAPLPNFSSGNLNYVNLKPRTVRQRDDEVKVDYNISSKLRLMGEYFDERVAENNPCPSPKLYLSENNPLWDRDVTSCTVPSSASGILARDT